MRNFKIICDDLTLLVIVNVKSKLHFDTNPNTMTMIEIDLEGIYFDLSKLRLTTKESY